MTQDAKTLLEAAREWVELGPELPGVSHEDEFEARDLLRRIDDYLSAPQDGEATEGSECDCTSMETCNCVDRTSYGRKVAALTRNAEPVVAIKPLQWVELAADRWRASTVIGEYRVSGSQAWLGSFHVTFGGNPVGADMAKSKADGFAAAQSHFDATIRSALSATPPVAQTGTVGISDAMVERARSAILHANVFVSPEHIRCALEAALSAPTVEDKP